MHGSRSTNHVHLVVTFLEFSTTGNIFETRDRTVDGLGPFPKLPRRPLSSRCLTLRLVPSTVPHCQSSSTRFLSDKLIQFVYLGRFLHQSQCMISSPQQFEKGSRASNEIGFRTLRSPPFLPHMRRGAGEETLGRIQSWSEYRPVSCCSVAGVGAIWSELLYLSIL